MAKEETKTEPAKAREAEEKWIVDGKFVGEEAYLAAAEKAGWDRNHLLMFPERRPAISTKKHGE